MEMRGSITSLACRPLREASGLSEEIKTQPLPPCHQMQWSLMDRFLHGAFSTWVKWTRQIEEAVARQNRRIYRRKVRNFPAHSRPGESCCWCSKY
ncbi:hypothetical protein PoB_007570600 [Plakobranchus ocellatus]|uniref:Uncharacterized protein n=1 Tax=Plakobranchus ocellatus TaxID=259542 RepID=A0AAV4DZC6_9GAST|nr:hypothetical protein PoB_007570600 [Plakobranchus ocellatus]